MESSEIGALLRHQAAGATVRNCVDSFPCIQMEAQLQPITRLEAPDPVLCALHPVLNFLTPVLHPFTLVLYILSPIFYFRDPVLNILNNPVLWIAESYRI